MPLEEWAVNVIDWPLSIAGVEGVTPPAARAGLTVTVSPAEQAETGEKAWSVTLYEKVVVLLVETKYVEEVAPEINAVQEPSRYHW